MGSIRLGNACVGVRHLSASVRSVVESLLHLMQVRDGSGAVDCGDQPICLELFDRIAALDEHRKLEVPAFRIYFRGFEPFVRAAQADLVIDRPIRPSDFDKALVQASARSPRDVKQVSRTLGASEVLRWLSRNRSAPLVHLRVVGMGVWWCGLCSEEVYGTPLGPLGSPNPDSPLHFLLDASLERMPAAPGVRLSFEQWVYAIAQHSDGKELLDHDDHRLLVLDRSVAVMANNRDFARLSALFLRPLSVVDAARLGRIAPESVRRFLNASLVIGRVRAIDRSTTAKPAPIDHEQPAAESAPKPAPGLFSRLFKRLMEGRADVR